jgi:sulfatase modifying factor 1
VRDPLRAFVTDPSTACSVWRAGEFLMGNEGDYGFVADGEGPVHAVVVSPFYIDATCVTNEQFNAFVNATGYKTEAERFGWSFVFVGHLSPSVARERARSRVAGERVVVSD